MATILVIEDETILRGEVVDWLTLEGFETTSAEDGMAGVEAAFHHPPDLIICDITMPRLDGHGVLLEMRANPATADIPFIFVTARAAHEDVRKGMDLGADDYIIKPFTRLELLHAIQTRLEKKAAQEHHYQREVDQWQQAFAEEREKRLLKAKLIAMFSHDFRNPLASILSSISLVRDYADRMDEQRRLRHLNRAEASVRQLVQMLEDMMVASQMETGSLNFEPEPLDIKAFLQSIVETFQIQHGETHPLVFESHFTDSAMADPRLLRQIATNLISNAIKYSPEGREIRVLLERYHDRGVLTLTVQDQGIGVSEVEQPNLFNAFQRASNVGEVRGSGLGLAIVKQAVELYGGVVRLESRLGEGTTVIVELPI